MSEWSSTLIERTRAALCDFAFMPSSDHLFFKHPTGRFGAIAVTDIVSGRLLMIDRESERETLYPDADALIGDGWVLD
jgi:hypothetical protein